jgi:hypothetical protein
MQAYDGKMRDADVMDTEQDLFRIGNIGQIRLANVSCTAKIDALTHP